MRAIRGAVTVKTNSKRDILEAASELLKTIIRENNLPNDEIVSILFTATSDLDKIYPAVAARDLNLKLVPLLCFQEMEVINSLKKCIRVMVYINRECELGEIKHIYLRDAVILRPDLISRKNSQYPNNNSRNQEE